MFQSKTVFVIGAGASADLGLPYGNVFRNQIADTLSRVWYDGSGRLSGPVEIQKALVTRAHRDATEQTMYLSAARRIASTLDGVRSIDEFIDHHSGDRYIEFVAKVAICWSILNAEKQGHLLKPVGDDPHNRMLDMAALAHTDAWLLELWHMLREGGHVSAPAAIFENVAFIVFNYDRSLEVFLTLRVRDMFNLTIAEAQKVVEGVTIIHPFGRVGALPSSGSEGVAYGHPNDSDLGELAGNILTFGESNRDEALSSIIRELMAEAHNLVVLGFAFHDQNMDFFASSSARKYPNTYATAYKLPEENWAEIRLALRHQMKRDASGRSYVPVLKDCKGAELLRVYNKPLRA